jgi:hypothetical protein
MSSKTIMRCLTLAASLTVLACSEAGNSSGSDSFGPGSSIAGTPSELLDVGNPSQPSDTSATEPSGVGNGPRLSHEELKQQLEQEKAYFKAQREANRAALKAAQADWKAWKQSWKEQTKLANEAWKRDHPGQKGGPEETQLLRCEPRDYQAEAAIIGPHGGTLHVGEHELVIPAGALDHEELIVGEAPTSSLVDVSFAPHGLQFQKPAELKLSYKGCVVPTDSDLFVAYLGQANKVLELPPSHDDKFDGVVNADIEHFSRYALAW